MSMQTDSWIDKILAKCPAITQDNATELELVDILIDKCESFAVKNNMPLGELWASAFDLLISAEYYTSVSHSGWLYCPDIEPRLFFHFTNCCPRHVLSDNFFFHPSNKPTSGKIGVATSRLLLLFIKRIFIKRGLNEDVLKGTEPVDAVVVNKDLKKILFAEIKASPLLTLSLSTTIEKLTIEIEGDIIDSDHIDSVNSNLYNNPVDILVPALENGKWVAQYYSLGERRDKEDIYWGFRGFINLIKTNDAFFQDYFSYWKESFNAYYPKANKSIFWLTNACGTPSPLPESWAKRRVGSGYESVSDSKTSVGMDRTDDIKKGIYQVLKLGSEGKPFASEWDYKVGIISNIHPARHFDQYLKSLKDIVWTNDETGRSKYIKDLPGDQKIFNLFDGIIAFTKTYSRDEWVDKLSSETE